MVNINKVERGVVKVPYTEYLLFSDTENTKRKKRRNWNGYG